MPARVLLQDFTGVPCVVDLAAMRDGIARLGPHRVVDAEPGREPVEHRRRRVHQHQVGPALLDLFHVVEELEEHDPGEHRQAIEVAVEALVLAHDVARGLEQAAEGLGSGGIHS